MCIYDLFMWEDSYCKTETERSQKMLLAYMSAIFHTCALFFINMSAFDFYIFLLYRMLMGRFRGLWHLLQASERSERGFQHLLQLPLFPGSAYSSKGWRALRDALILEVSFGARVWLSVLKAARGCKLNMSAASLASIQEPAGHKNPTYGLYSVPWLNDCWVLLKTKTLSWLMTFS